MSEEEKGSGGAPNQDASGNDKETDAQAASGDQNSVKYETYRKVLSEAKKARERLEELEGKITTLEQEKLQAEGNKDELITNLRKENQALNSKLSGAVQSFARSKIESAVIAEASRLGCQDAQLLIRAYGDDVEGIDFDDKFNPDIDQVKVLVEKIRSEKKFLFSKDAPRIANHQIKTEQEQGGTKTLGKMKDDELMALWAKAER